jgi:hypothetical protein
MGHFKIGILGSLKTIKNLLVNVNVAKTMGMELEIGILASLTRSPNLRVVKEAKGNLSNLFLGKTIKCVFNFCLR